MKKRSWRPHDRQPWGNPSRHGAPGASARSNGGVEDYQNRASMRLCHMRRSVHAPVLDGRLEQGELVRAQLRAVLDDDVRVALSGRHVHGCRNGGAGGWGGWFGRGWGWGL